MNLASLLFRLTALFVFLFLAWVALGFVVGPDAAAGMDELLGSLAVG